MGRHVPSRLYDGRIEKTRLHQCFELTIFVRGPSTIWRYERRWIRGFIPLGLRGKAILIKGLEGFVESRFGFYGSRCGTIVVVNDHARLFASATREEDGPGDGKREKEDAGEAVSGGGHEHGKELSRRR